MTKQTIRKQTTQLKNWQIFEQISTEKNKSESVGRLCGSHCNSIEIYISTALESTGFKKNKDETKYLVPSVQFSRSVVSDSATP